MKEKKSSEADQFVDLLIFEESFRQEYLRLKSIKRKYTCKSCHTYRMTLENHLNILSLISLFVVVEYILSVWGLAGHIAASLPVFSISRLLSGWTEHIVALLSKWTVSRHLGSTTQVYSASQPSLEALQCEACNHESRLAQVVSPA